MTNEGSMPYPENATDDAGKRARMGDKKSANEDTFVKQ